MDLLTLIVIVVYNVNGTTFELAFVQPVNPHISTLISFLLLLPHRVNRHLALLSEGLHGIGVIDVVMPRPEMIQARTYTG